MSGNRITGYATGIPSSTKMFSRYTVSRKMIGLLTSLTAWVTSTARKRTGFTLSYSQQNQMAVSAVSIAGTRSIVMQRDGVTQGHAD